MVYNNINNDILSDILKRISCSYYLSKGIYFKNESSTLNKKFYNFNKNNDYLSLKNLNELLKNEDIYKDIISIEASSGVNNSIIIIIKDDKYENILSLIQLYNILN